MEPLNLHETNIELAATIRVLKARAEQAERERDEALNLIGRIASGEGGGFNWAVRMAQEWSTARTERLVQEREAPLTAYEQAQEQRSRLPKRRGNTWSARAQEAFEQAQR